LLSNQLTSLSARFASCSFSLRVVVSVHIAFSPRAFNFAGQFYDSLFLPSFGQVPSLAFLVVSLPFCKALCLLLKPMFLLIGCGLLTIGVSCNSLPVSFLSATKKRFFDSPFSSCLCVHFLRPHLTYWRNIFSLDSDSFRVGLLGRFVLLFPTALPKAVFLPPQSGSFFLQLFFRPLFSVSSLFFCGRCPPTFLMSLIVILDAACVSLQML